MKNSCGITSFVFCLILLLSGCKDELPIEKDLSDVQLKFVNEEGQKKTFPDDYKGRILLFSLMFTHCPDICPMTTNNLYRVQQALIKEKIPDIEFISFSFDPQRDTPFVLNQYAEVRDINTQEWDFLSSSQESVDSLKKILGYIAIAGDTSFTPEGNPYYFFVHTDKMFLVDRESRIRGSYKGSEINLEQIVNDIKKLN